MQINNIKKYSLHINNSFLFKLGHCRDIVLFNCSESLQSYIISKQIRMNNVTKIIITNLHINNISGLLGLLSSLNSIGRIKDLHIYGPSCLSSYLDLGKKYSHTNFKYVLYIHNLTDGLIINHHKYRIYTFSNTNCFDFFVISVELAGTFMMKKASNYYLFPGPLYSKLKKGHTFVLPDGLVLNGSCFTYFNNQGIKFVFMFNDYYYRKSIQNTMKSIILLIK